MAGLPPLLLLSTVLIACVGDPDSPLGSATDDSGDTQPTNGSRYADSLDWRLHDDIGSMVIVSWEQKLPATMHVEYSFDDGDWLQTPPRSFGLGHAEQLVVGIPFGTDARWRVVADDGEAADGAMITTAPLPTGLPEGEVRVSRPDAWQPEDRYLLTSINQETGGWHSGTYWTIIIDRQGRTVWAHPAPDHHWTLFAQVSQDGRTILWDEATYWADYDGGAGSSVHRTYLDEEIDEIATPGLHHSFVQLPDGQTLVWGSQYHGGGEALVERTIGDDEERVLWTAADDWPGVDDCESNGLFYDAETDTFLYSFYTNSSIVSVDHKTGRSLWWAGTVPDGYAFDPELSQFDWQHGISYTADRTLLVSTRAYGKTGNTTMVREYEVDADHATLREVWSYDPHIHATTNGDAWRLDNGNTLHLLGSAGQVVEVDPDGEFVWQVDFNGTYLLGRGEYIDDLYSLVSPQG
ncbi:MAG: hypothetical protein D6798_05240 [Deltaproteobacteria bacterium]|nr:MAG: hypothetical protein D6798_05240 [Deltaproteobacteria bacterium]